MIPIIDHPFLLFVLSFILLSISARIGVFVKKRRQVTDEERQDIGIVEAAILTLLGLIIGFSFSMAVDRYNQRKIYEEEEANAIGTEYLRLGLLSNADVSGARALLLDYLDQRILFYTSHNSQQIQQINVQTGKLQEELWSLVQAAGIAQPTPVMALVVSGMNDVLNSQGYTQAAWRNRIPVSAWALMGAIAVFCNVMVGFSARRPKSESVLLLVLPLILSVAFFLIADIESPHGGLIRLYPQNLLSLSESLKSSATIRPQSDQH